MKQLTRAEEQVMHALWKKENAFLRDIVEEMAAPKPHQNTVATLLKILTDKGFVGIHVINRYHQYYPLISKSEYSKKSLKQFVQGYFDGSASALVSFFVKEKNVSIRELEELIIELKKKKKA